jgi:hypothetical protein
MSAYVDSKTPGGYGDTGTSSPEPAKMTATSGGDSGNGAWWQTMIGNAVNRYMDVETYKATGGQVPPSYYNPALGGKVQAINTGTQYTTNSTVAGVPIWALAIGAVALVMFLRK